VRFDLFGFATLSIAIAALQLLLDRGEQNDWFSSTESWVEAITCVISLAYFGVHTVLTPAGKSFFDYRLLRNRNYISGIALMFLVAMILFSTRALIATMLQDLFDYPASTAGFVMAPGGIGTMAAMLVVGRLTGRVDVRILLTVGFAVVAFSSWQMTQYDLTITQSAVIVPSIIQGVGLGLVFVPLATAAFATLSPELRADGTAIFSLMRNIGSAIGISVAQSQLVRNTQIAHAGIIENLGNNNGNVVTSPLGAAFHLPSLTGAASLNAEITRQATMIGYLDDYRLMLIVTVIVIPLLLLMRPATRDAAAAAGGVALE
jgi:DHA2 family multidrug resistance protein